MKAPRDFWETFIFCAIVAALFGVFVLLLYEDVECDKRGGVMVQTFWGPECIPLKQLKKESGK